MKDLQVIAELAGEQIIKTSEEFGKINKLSSINSMYHLSLAGLFLISASSVDIDSLKNTIDHYIEEGIKLRNRLMN